MFKELFNQSQLSLIKVFEDLNFLDIFFYKKE